MCCGGLWAKFGEDLGLSEGQEVEIQVRTLSNKVRSPGEGFIRTEGALADDTEWDAIMREIHEARRVERRQPAADLGEP